jgi:putative Mg2+ transporter-C (MgtC) family protein
LDVTINLGFPEIFLRIAVAALLGFVLGVEREFHHKAAGLRTNVLIGMGSAMFTIVSALMPGGDHARIAAQIVTGVGFLGAGAILHREGSVQGLTTASVIWMNAALGMTSGAGHPWIACGVTALVVGVLVLTRPVESWFDRRNKGPWPPGDGRSHA